MEPARLDGRVPRTQDELIRLDAAGAVRRAALAIEAHRHDVIKIFRYGQSPREDALHEGNLAARDHLLLMRLAVDGADCLAVTALHAVRHRVIEICEQRGVLRIEIGCRYFLLL